MVIRSFHRLTAINRCTTPFLARIGFLLLWMGTTVTVLAATTAPAYGEQPSIEGMLENIGGDGTVDPEAGLSDPTTSAVNLEVQWRLFHRSLSSGDPGLAELEGVRFDAQSLGVASLPYHQMALLHIAQRHEHHDLDSDEASRLIDTAHKFAPHLPYAKLELASHRLDEGIGSAHRAIPPYAEGVHRGYQWLDTRIGWALKGALLVLIAMALGFAGFLLGQLLRYFGIAAYDGTRLLPRGFSSTQTVILLVAIVLVPGLLMQSPLLSMLLLLMLIVPFQQINERIVSLVFFALIAALPFADAQLGKFVNYPGSDAQKLLHAHYHGCTETCRPWLESVAADDDDGAARYVERVDLFRTNSREAIEELHQWFQSNSPEQNKALEVNWLTLEGAVLIATGESEQALDVLERAAAIDRSAPAPWFNQARAYQLLDDQDAGHQALQQAFSRDLSSVSRQIDFARRDAHSFLMLDPASSDIIWKNYAPVAEDAPSLITPFWTIAAGEKLRLDHAPWLGLAGILFLLLTLPFYLRHSVSSPCPKCGLARDPTESDQSADHHYCLPCYQTFVSGSSMDYHARVHSETTLGRRDRLQSFLRRIFSLCSPGVGHIIGGHAIRGTLTLVALLVGVLILLYPLGPFGVWRGPFELFRDHWAGQTVLAWLLISVAASVGLTGLWRGIDPTRKRSSTSKNSGEQR